MQPALDHIGDAGTMWVTNQNQVFIDGVNVP
jgi:hypothetical protein